MNEILLPLSPWVYEFGNSQISSLALCLVIILCRFFLVEVYWLGGLGAYGRLEFKLGLSIAAILSGEASYRAWTWWGRYCANTDVLNCNWMLTKAWPLVPIISIALEITGMLCMIRVLIPDVWGTRAWIISAFLSLTWSAYWFSSWPEVFSALEVGLGLR
jgi:hypothetical protein